ncbi:MAG TPA: DUF3311 domain-containing protein [Roseiarcus sp.]|jgi:hypothetical protein|nr:DUF3311 domain-containing protein [Roseiarcus sp.]
MSEEERLGASASGGAMKYVLLFAPCLIALAAPLYNSIDPTLAGVPFFYWAQLLLIPVSAICIFIADRIAKARP